MYFPPLPHILLGRNVFNNPLHKLWDRSKNNKVIFSEKLVGFLKEVLKNFQILVKFSEKPFRGGLSLLHLLQPPGNIDHFFTPIEAGHANTCMAGDLDGEDRVPTVGRAEKETRLSANPYKQTFRILDEIRGDILL